MTQSGDELDSLLESALPMAFRGGPGHGTTPDAAHTTPQVIPGQVGGFRVLGVLDEGGVGIVLRAHDADCEREVAIKLLKSQALRKPAVVEAFQTEARTLARLDHPAIVPVHARGELDDGTPWFAMKLVQGRTLGDLLAERDSPEDNSARFLEIFRQVCRAVGYAHQQGLLHMDVKPANVMITEREGVFVIDWGFARDARPGEGGVGARAGTPAYMSPEQAVGRGDTVGPASDVFGLGAVLCEILTGAAPYEGDSTEEVLLKATKGWTDAALERLAAAPADPIVKNLARRCLDADPARRPSDGSAVAAEVASWFESLESRQRELEREAAATAAREAVQRRTRRRALATGAVLLVAAAGIWMYLSVQAANRREASWGALRVSDVAVAKAREAEATDVVAWEAAVTAARSAEDQMEALAAERDHRETAQALALEATAGAVRARHTAELKDRLEGLSTGHSYALKVRQSAEAAARALGIDPDDFDIEGAADVIRSHVLRREIIQGFDIWSVSLIQIESPLWKQVTRVALLADEDLHANRMRECILEDRFDDLEATARSDEVDAFSAGALLLMARHLTQRGSGDLAIATLEKAVDLHPGSYHCCHALLSELESRELFGRCERPLWMALALQPDNAHIWGHRAGWHISRKEWKEALAAADEAIRLRTGSSDALGHRLAALDGLGRTDEALETALEFLDRVPHAQAVAIQAGKLLSGKGLRRRAVAMLERSIAATPNKPSRALLLNYKGDTLLEMGCVPDAKETLRQSLSLIEANLPAQTSLARVLAIEGDPEWRGIVDRITKASSAHPRSLMTCAQTLDLTGHFEEARAVTRDIQDRVKRHKLPFEVNVAGYQKQLDLLCRMEERYRDRGSSALEELGTGECYALSRVALARGRYLESARIFLHLTARSNGATGWNTLHAARAAAGASAGLGTDASRLDDGERRRWERRAQRWVKAGLGALRPLVKRNAGFANELIYLKFSKDFATVRSEDADERWHDLWAELDEILEGLGGPPVPDR